MEEDTQVIITVPPIETETGKIRSSFMCLQLHPEEETSAAAENTPWSSAAAMSESSHSHCPSSLTSANRLWISHD